MKNILVLTNFSSRSGYASEFAMNMAIQNAANLYLCHAMELTSNLGDGLELNWPIADNLVLQDENIAELRELRKHLEKMIPADPSNLLSKPIIRFVTDFGLLAEVAERVISEKSIDLVVIGSHKATSFSKFLLGSHAHTLLDKISCPVLLVPEGLKFKGIKHVAYATDLSFNNQKVIQYLGEMAKPFNATISVNHISPLEPTEVLEPTKVNKDHNALVYNTIKGDNVKEELLKMTAEGKLDILTLVHKRYDYFDRLFHTSISKQMADNAKVPLLVMPSSFIMENAVN